MIHVYYTKIDQMPRTDFHLLLEDGTPDMVSPVEMAGDCISRDTYEFIKSYDPHSVGVLKFPSTFSPEYQAKVRWVQGKGRKVIL